MKYIVKKLITLIITLFIVSTLTFTAFQIIPGDSVLASLGTNATPEAIDAMRDDLGLNDNVIVRYGHWLGGVLHGDFGMSTQYDLPVSSLLGERFVVTAWLAVLTILLIVMISLPIGILSARKAGGILDRVLGLVTQTLMAIPPFFLGMILTLIFGVILKW
ncbi:MAG TPA: ABC transporter permease, partial [Lachnospiraceae bacterium]|nr:ABC transporter permease [Lachnospiraceae bacterium]